MQSPISVLLILSATALVTSCGTAQSQSEETRNTKNVVSDNSDYYRRDFLLSDFHQADVVAYVDSREIISVVPSDDRTDCTNLGSYTGLGYCGFIIQAKIRELYKGKISSETIEYFEYGEAALIKSKARFLGPQVVFLQEFEDEKSKKVSYQAIENSTRRIEYDVISKMRKISKYKIKTKPE